MLATETRPQSSLTDQEISRLARKRVFFGHQSVGDDIIRGIKDLKSSDPRLKLDITVSEDPQSFTKPGLIEFHIGQNRNPQSKDEAFAAILAKGMGTQGGIATYKYCYIDIDADTDIPRTFERYRKNITAVKAAYPALKILHITVPLTTVEPALRAWARSMLGRITSRDVAAKRQQFNSLLKQAFGGDPIFDLAEVESTHTDGSREYIVHKGSKVFTLAPELTTDGGHLNEAGRMAAAGRLLKVLSQI